MLAGCDVEPMSADQASHVGELGGRADHDDVVDVAVVEGAVRREDDAIITSNESHIRKIVAATRRTIRIDTV
jgi:coenzyme F420-reducing hydrogenase gamma subunit